jgi:hypothetical protein
MVKTELSKIECMAHDPRGLHGKKSPISGRAGGGRGIVPPRLTPPYNFQELGIAEVQAGFVFSIFLVCIPR